MSPSATVVCVIPGGQLWYSHLNNALIVGGNALHIRQTCALGLQLAGNTASGAKSR